MSNATVTAVDPDKNSTFTTAEASTDLVRSPKISLGGFEGAGAPIVLFNCCPRENATMVQYVLCCAALSP